MGFSSKEPQDVREWLDLDPTGCPDEFGARADGSLWIWWD